MQTVKTKAYTTECNVTFYDNFAVDGSKLVVKNFKEYGKKSSKKMIKLAETYAKEHDLKMCAVDDYEVKADIYFMPKEEFVKIAFVKTEENEFEEEK